ncbi:MarR family winged helix-turn-helix transcriptional regulator [Ornithinibacillus xuwenensis]|uniref:MarR family transcriptional regulator n=1 Tax=Ornithinibacillus xuwenensis TaxID=3144668 RepID=A0ABU9XIF0_9BACI
MNLFSTIYRFNKRYVLRLQEICSANGITAVQWLVLHHIAENDGCTSMDIVKEWSVEKPTVSTLVHKLREQGLIHFKNGEDKRQKYLSLTYEGQALCETVTEKVMHLQSFVTEPLSEEVVQEYTAKINTLEERLKEYER